MRHAVLGAGGIGGLIGAALARHGAEVVLLMRPASLAGYSGAIAVESPTLGSFEVAIPAVPLLDREVDVLWVTTKATGLDAALALAPADRVGPALVVPLLNGVDHVARLRAVYANVLPGAIRVESERLADGRIRQASGFLRIHLAGGEELARELEAAGMVAVVQPDETTLLWEKLSILAPVALVTTALAAPLGVARRDERFRLCQDEAFAVAEAEGAVIYPDAMRAVLDSVSDGMRSSMQKDVEAGREPELDAIAGPILRGGARHGIAVPATQSLVTAIAGG